MKPFLLSLWNDPAKFTALCRSLAFGLAVMAQQGAIPGAGTQKGWWLTFAVQAASLAVPSSAGKKT